MLKYILLSLSILFSTTAIANTNSTETPVVAEVCTSGQIDTDEAVIQKLMKYKEDSIYKFEGESFTRLTKTLVEAFELPPNTFSSASEVFLSVGPSAGGGALFVFFNGDCYLNHKTIPMNLFEAVIGLYGELPTPIYVGNGRDA